MSERRELRSRREERMENGVKNLKGSEAICQNLSLSKESWERKNVKERTKRLKCVYLFELFIFSHNDQNITVL
jgi:hypothetical protein